MKTAHNRMDLTGQVFGRLTVVGYAYTKRNRSYWTCQCLCGTTTTTMGGSLKNGDTQSCGCIHRERAATLNTAPLAERFWAKVDKSGPTPTCCAPHYGNCWLWTANTTQQGYGRIEVENRLRQATHVSWFLLYGVWPTSDLCHVCDNPACVRPTHLFEGTDAANQYDRSLKAQGAVLIESCDGPVQ